MNLSSQGLQFIERWEGPLQLKAYKPTPNDVWTIGWGHVRGVYQGMICTPFEADEWLAEDTGYAADCVNERVKVNLSQNEFDACVSLVYNVGILAFTRSQALVDINRYDQPGFLDQAFSPERGWTRQNGEILPGLVNRRAAEQSLFVNGIYGVVQAAEAV